MKNSIKTLVVAALVLESACSQASGFEGKWQQVDGNKSTIQITKISNDLFEMQENANSWFTGKDYVTKTGMRREGDHLKIGDGMLSATINHLKDNDHIIMMQAGGVSREYQRVK